MECVPEISLCLAPLSVDSIFGDTSNHITPYRSAFHGCASRSRAHVSASSRCQVSAASNIQFLQYLRKIDSVRPGTDVVHTDLFQDKL